MRAPAGVSVIAAPARARPAQAGFTLVELAVVIAVIALLLGTMLPPLVAQLRIREVREAEQRMQVIHDALIGFAQSQGRLPCPDTNGVPDGNENFPCGGGGVVTGVLPWSTLGLPPFDRWGNFYRYSVTREFAGSAVPGAVATPNGIDLNDVGAVTVSGDRDNAKNPVTVTTQAAAAVSSTGANGFCAIRYSDDSSAVQQLAPPDGGVRWNCNNLTGAGGADEFENMNSNAVFSARRPSEGGDACDDAAGSPGPLCAFDDLVVWIPTTLLFGKLVTAGWLP